MVSACSDAKRRDRRQQRAAALADLLGVLAGVADHAEIGVTELMNLLAVFANGAHAVRLGVGMGSNVLGQLGDTVDRIDDTPESGISQLALLGGVAGVLDLLFLYPTHYPFSFLH